MNASTTVVPVILSGGSGTRLWPLSREHNPKQFLPLLSGASLFQETVLRARQVSPAPPVVICNAEHRFVVEEQLAQIGVTPAAIACEPVGRNTAAAVAVAAALVGETDPDAALLVLPSDHALPDASAFAREVAVALPAAAAGYLVTFGVTPTMPHTGFGYIQQGPALAGIDRVHSAESFVEKPDLARARNYVREGKWLWNSGMFLLPRRTVLEELATHEPLAARAPAISVALAERHGAVVMLESESFSAAPSISLDYAVMERTERAAVLPTSVSWSDVGAWSALWDVQSKDESGNVTEGDVLTVQSKDCYLRSDGPLVAAVGLEGVTVVACDDAVLVTDRQHSQEVREIVSRLRAEGRSEAHSAPLVSRPWGTYESVDHGAGHQVKHIVVKPGQKLSLQRHQHRAEHWVVVSGEARVTKGEERLTLRVNEALFIPQGCVHRLENPTSEPLHLIEVQVGGYLGEDDIERLADDYGRG